jgi:hypothetical protein
MSGPSFIFAAPIVALFGWFYLLPIGVFVAVVWALYGSHWAARRHRVVLMLCCAVVGAGFMLVCGVRGPEPGWLRGYLVGGFLGGALGGYLVTILKREKAQPGAAPNGGPATPVGKGRFGPGGPG